MAGRVKRRVILAPLVIRCTDTHCDAACQALSGMWAGDTLCGAFGKRDGDVYLRNLAHDANGRYLRCPECIEAEKRGAK